MIKFAVWTLGFVGWGGGVDAWMFGCEIGLSDWHPSTCTYATRPGSQAHQRGATCIHLVAFGPAAATVHSPRTAIRGRPHRREHPRTIYVAAGGMAGVQHLSGERSAHDSEKSRPSRGIKPAVY